MENDRYNTPIYMYIYSDIAARKYELPVFDSGSSSIILEKSVFDLAEDIIIPLYCLDEKWMFYPKLPDGRNVDFSVAKDDIPWFEKKTEYGEFLELSSGKERFTVVFTKKKQNLELLDLYVRGNDRNYTIGSSDNCTFTIWGNRMIDSSHAVLVFESQGTKVEWAIKPQNNNRVYVNGRTINKITNLGYGDVIDIFGFKAIILGDFIGVYPLEITKSSYTVNLKKTTAEDIYWNAHLSIEGKDKKDIDQSDVFRSSPRVINEYDSNEIVIDPVPNPVQQRERSLFNVVGPSLIMIFPMVLGIVLAENSKSIGSYMSILSALGMMLLSYKNMRDSKKELEKNEHLRKEKYRNYLAEKENDIKKKYEYNIEATYRMYPPSSSCVKYDSSSEGLWNRNHMQSDFYKIRLGIGTIKNPNKISIPGERFSLVDDELISVPKDIKKKYQNLANVPVCVDMAENPLYGIIDEYIFDDYYSILRTLITQITANYSSSDVKIVCICDESRSEDLELMNSIKSFPHLWTDDGSLRLLGCNNESMARVIDYVEPVLMDRLRKTEDRKEAGAVPHFVFLITRPNLIENKTIKEYLYSDYKNKGFTTFVCAETLNELPNVCENIIQKTKAFSGLYSLKQSKDKYQEIKFDEVSYRSLHDLSLRLSRINLQTLEAAKEIPSALTFLDMYKVHNVENLNILGRWKNARSDQSLLVPFGVGNGELPVNLDIHEKGNGVHGLVAGTTGSGKSEALISWVLSMAVNYSPEDVSFLLIDFKGGSLVNEFDNSMHHLPHLAGTMTNLGGNEIERALVSINSESLRRQRLFAESGAHDIYEYIRMYRSREVDEVIPHLVIVIDEFAELKSQYPDFMDEIISIGRVGRSLGIHLILATQSPEGTVDSKITDNMSFYISLRVQTAAGSKSVIGTPDAAYIDEKIKGRGYFRSGSNIPQQVQCAWCRAEYDPSDSNAKDLAALTNISGDIEVSGTHRIQKIKSENEIKVIEQLLKCVNNVLTENNYFAVKQYINDGDIAKHINSSLYESFDDYGLNITPSAENDIKIANFMEVYAICQENNADVDAKAIYLEASKSNRRLPESKEKTQLDVVIEKISKIAATNDLELKRKLWLPRLRDNIYYADIVSETDTKEAENSFELETTIGLFDDPENQYQGQVVMDLANVGNYMVCGSSSSGKSTLLQTAVYGLVEKYSPDDVNIYILDFSSHVLECFSEAPHVGGILFESDLDSIEKMMFLLNKELADRKNRLRGGSYAQFRRMGNRMPAAVMIIDNYGSFKEKTNNKWSDTVLRLCKEGTQYGIYLILTGAGISNAEISSKLADSIKGRICLQMNDTFSYKEILNITGYSKVIVPDTRQGRGLIYRNGKALEFQTAIAEKAANEFERTENIDTRCRKMKEDWKGDPIKTVPIIPEDPYYSQFIALPAVNEQLQDDRSIPIGYLQSSAYPYAVDLSTIFSFNIVGASKKGRINMLCNMLQTVKAKGATVYLFGTGTGVLKKMASDLEVNYYSQDDDLKEFCVQFTDVLLERNKKKNELEEAGLSDSELYDEMSKNETIFIFIEDLNTFTDALYSTDSSRTRVNGFFESLSEKCWYHQIFIVSGIDTEKVSEIKGHKFYRNIVHDHSGVLVGGGANNQDILSFDYLEYKERNEILPSTVGLVSYGDGRAPVGKIIIPSSGR